jgi:O-acetyl-ADP-ribose deacetylase
MEYGMELRIEPGDITRQSVDAIVNAANSGLLGGGGVDGAIHRRGGPEILEACRLLRATEMPEGLPAGQAVATTAGRLDARWVIHTVGPVYAQTVDHSDTLVSCYRESLRLAAGLGARSIAFPAISAGIYGWPMDDAARIAVQTCRALASEVGPDAGPVAAVVFVPFSEAAERAFRAALEASPNRPD